MSIKMFKIFKYSGDNELMFERLPPPWQKPQALAPIPQSMCITPRGRYSMTAWKAMNADVIEQVLSAFIAKVHAINADINNVYIDKERLRRMLEIKMYKSSYNNNKKDASA